MGKDGSKNIRSETDKIASQTPTSLSIFLLSVLSSICPFYLNLN